MPTTVTAHITGTIWKIVVKEGETVTEGQECVIVESMKMEMPVEAPHAGVVERILVAEGRGRSEGMPSSRIGVLPPDVARRRLTDGPMGAGRRRSGGARPPNGRARQKTRPLV